MERNEHAHVELSDDRIRVLGSAAGDWFHCSERVFPAGLSIGQHAHDRPSVAIGLEGHGVESAGGVRYELPAGSLLVRPGGVLHENAVEGRAVRALVVDVDPDVGEPIRDFLSEMRWMWRPELLGDAERICAELRASDEMRTFAIEGLVIQLFVGLCRLDLDASGRSRPRWLRETVAHIREALPDTVSTRQLAERAGVHPAHLARVFKQATGHTVAAYSRRLRIERAAALLAETDEPIADVGIECGFSDQAHFTRAFRNVVGTSPGAYRNLVR